MKDNPQSPAQALRDTAERAKEMHRLYPFTRTQSSAARGRRSETGFPFCAGDHVIVARQVHKGMIVGMWPNFDHDWLIRLDDGRLIPADVEDLRWPE